MTPCLRVHLLALLSVLTCLSPARGQEPKALARWERLLDTPLRAITKHDLRWIPQAKPPQAKPPPRGPFVDCEPLVPLERLRYLGYRRPRELEPWKGLHTIPRGLRHPYHVYRYRGFSVLTETDGRREQLSVYALARALELLRLRLPRAYAQLFVGPKTPREQLRALRRYDPKKSVHFLNLTRTHVFVFKGRGEQAIAASRYDLGPRRLEQVGKGAASPRLAVFRNVATTTLNLAAIQGYRSRKLYGHKKALTNFLLYLRDGLVETLVHEALHSLLRRDKNVRPLFWAITHSLRELGGEVLGKEAEEAFVTNVSQTLLAKHGLSREVRAFYRTRFLKTQRARLGLLKGKESDRGVALRALLRRHRKASSYAELFSFDLLPR